MKKLLLLTCIAGGLTLSEPVNAGPAHSTDRQCAAILIRERATHFPVRFDDLKVKYEDGRMMISWSALTGKNNKQFEIQRSADGIGFKTIAIIFTLNDEKEVKSYRFNDELKGVQGNKITYRIKQVDITEKYTFSQTISPVI